MKQGNVNAIINYANTARAPKVWILAGNYLQSTQWQSDQNVMKNIVTFYSKAKAFDHLANFFEA